MPNANHYGLILAGGRGTRFWPRSRKRRAKQVLSVTSERSLIQQTVDRLRPVIPPERIWILTNDFVRDEIVRQLPEVPPEQIIAEPAQRNTAPAIGLAAHILQSVDPDAVFGVFPSDHLIGNPEHYLTLLRTALQAASDGGMAVLGVQPRWPETGYGYIEYSPGVEPNGRLSIAVAKFHEKPKREKAEEFVAAGHYYWNAGMFFWRPGVILDALRSHLPKTATLLSSLPPFRDPDFSERLAHAFPLCEDISIDFGVLEPATRGGGNVVGVACENFGWNDVGSWDAVYEVLPRDGNNNAVRSEVLVHNSTGNFVDCGKKIVALVGVKDLVVVETDDALLIADRNRAQDVGAIVKMLEEQGREELL